MLDTELRKEIKELIECEVVPAIGCTEPVAVALAVAKATELLGSEAGEIEVSLSGNVLKNAMGVGIPGTGMIGLPIAIALGSLVGRSAYGLEVLKDVDEAAVAKGKELIAEKRIKIKHDSNAPSKLHIAAKVTDKDSLHSATAVISGTHTNFVLLEKDGEILFEQSAEGDGDEVQGGLDLNLAMVWDYAVESPLEELEFIMDAKHLNAEAARHALKGDGLGHKVGKIIHDKGAAFFGNSTVSKMLCMTAAACDARMAGEPVAVMSNSGSGNQGITITMPVVSFAEETGATHEQTVRALVMAHLTSIYIKRSLGRLSALCGCVVASTGASMAIVYLMGGDYAKGSYAVKNMIATLTGMICDGAKPACSLKITSGVGTALVSALMAMNDQCVTSTEGIISDCVDETISNFSSIGRDAMNETDRLVLEIMTGS